MTLPQSCSVAIVGSGPAGLGAAIGLAGRGVRDVVVLERDLEAGGVPRHCGHYPFGWREYRRLYKGPAYARTLVAQAGAAGVAIHCGVTVVRLGEGGALMLSTPDGERQLQARCVVLATGARETPRAARLVSGQRPAGVVTTGALQSMVYLNGEAPFRRPVIVGSELVSFSALLTCRHLGLGPAAMVESGVRLTAPALSRLLPMALTVPVYTGTRVTEVLGRSAVEGVRVVDRHGASSVIACDGVVFSGRFVPEATLARMGHLAVDEASGGPCVDQYGRCSDPVYFAAGNLLRPVETAGWSWKEGGETAGHVYAALRDALPAPQPATVIARVGAALRYALPQRVVLPATGGVRHLQLRVNGPVKGRLSLLAGERTLWRSSVRAIPERRMLVPMAPLRDVNEGQAITLRLDERP